MGFSKQEYWSGVPLPSPLLAIDFLNSEKSGSHHLLSIYFIFQSQCILIMVSELLTSTPMGINFIYSRTVSLLPLVLHTLGFPGGSAGEESACNVGDLASIPGLRIYPGEGNSHPFQYSGLENSMDCIVYGVTKSRTQLSEFHFHFTYFTHFQSYSCEHIFCIPFNEVFSYL